MNLQLKFTPSFELHKRSASAESTAEIATKAAAVDAVLSEEELNFARDQADNENAELARLYINGVLVRIGLEWQPGGEALWNANLKG